MTAVAGRSLLNRVAGGVRGRAAVHQLRLAWITVAGDDVSVTESAGSAV